MVRKKNKHFLSSILLLLFSLFIVGGSLLLDNKLKRRGEPLIVLTSSDVAPFSFYFGRELVGFDIDLINIVVKKLGRNIEIYDMPFYFILEQLRIFSPPKGDLAIAAIIKNSCRKSLMDTSIPYHSSFSVLLVRKDSDIKGENDLSKKTVAVRSGSIHEYVARTDWFPVFEDIKIANFTSLSRKELEQMKSNQLDAIFLDYEEALIYVAKNDFLKIIKLEDRENEFSIALPKGSRWTSKVNDIVKELIEDGTIEKLKNKWFAEKYIKKISKQVY